MKKLLEKQLNGLDGSSVRPGFLKATLNAGRNPLEISGYRAVCKLAAETGLPMLVHFMPEREYMREFVEMAVKEIGVKPEKLMLCHVNGLVCEPQSLGQYLRTSYAPVSVELHKQLLDYGVMLSFDGFGSPFASSSELTNSFAPSDYQCVTGLHKLMEAGYKDQLMAGHDFGCTISAVTWGRYGMTRVPEFVCPMLKLLGYGDDVIDTITKVNPKKFLSHE